MENKPRVWFLTGSQALYGQETLDQVAGQSQRIQRMLTESGGMGTSSPPWRAMCTVRAASSHITAALTASFGVTPIVKGPWLRMSTARDR